MTPEEQLIRRRPPRICGWCGYLDDPAEDLACPCTQHQIDELRRADHAATQRKSA